MSLTPEFVPSHVSVVNEFPEDLYDAMRNFVRNHPNWDQYRLMQVALAGFLFQQGSRERAVSRHYLDGLFDRGAGPEALSREGLAARDPEPSVSSRGVRPLAEAGRNGMGAAISERPGLEEQQDPAAASAANHPLAAPRMPLPAMNHRPGAPLPQRRFR